ncbi:MAG: efflux RND transporter periplasmic adaptor subunit, partial [Deltaproteobacteria bacterium]|nr:efflux RND transporter periplasmic adaptor subunit [Deltaproteobacteria bacterium]
VAENTPIIGVLYFDRVSGLSTEVAGMVKSVHFREGDRIKRGAVLLNLSTDFIDKEIELAETRIDEISVRIERADKDLERYGTLVRHKAIREKVHEDVGFERRELIKQRDALRKQLEITRLKKAKSIIRAPLSIIRAPFDGIVLAKGMDVGDWIDPGKEFCRIGSTEDVFVKVPIAEELLPYSGKGDIVNVTINAFDKRVRGKIAGILPVADPRTKNVMLKIRLPQMEIVVENMSATVYVPVSKRKRLKLIPRDALVNFQGKDIIYTVKEGKAAVLPIHIVAFVDEFAALDNKEIPKGMIVVVDGNDRLRPGQPVQIIRDTSQ